VPSTEDVEDMLAEGRWEDCACFVKYYAIRYRCTGGHKTDGIHRVLVVACGRIRGILIQ